MVRNLLRHGALLDEKACKTILPSTLEASLLDSCVPIAFKNKDDSSKNIPVSFDYSILLHRTIPPPHKEEPVKIYFSPNNQNSEDQQHRLTIVTGKF